MVSDITNSILRTADGTDYKGIDDYDLHEVIAAAITGADRPATTYVLEKLIEVISSTFNFLKKVSANSKLIQANSSRMETLGVAINDAQISLTIISNIEIATQDKYGRKFQPAMQIIRKNTPTTPSTMQLP